MGTGKGEDHSASLPLSSVHHRVVQQHTLFCPEKLTSPSSVTNFAVKSFASMKAGVLTLPLTSSANKTSIGTSSAILQVGFAALIADRDEHALIIISISNEEGAICLMSPVGELRIIVNQIIVTLRQYEFNKKSLLNTRNKRHCVGCNIKPLCK